MPKINPWICYGGGLLAGLLAYVVFDGNFWATIGGTVAWITFYTFGVAMRHGGDTNTNGASGPKGPDRSDMSRQQRRAADRRASKDSEA